MAVLYHSPAWRASTEEVVLYAWPGRHEHDSSTWEPDTPVKAVQKVG